MASGCILLLLKNARRILPFCCEVTIVAMIRRQWCVGAVLQQQFFAVGSKSTYYQILNDSALLEAEFRISAKIH